MRQKPPENSERRPGRGRRCQLEMLLTPRFYHTPPRKQQQIPAGATIWSPISTLPATASTAKRTLCSGAFDLREQLLVRTRSRLDDAPRLIASSAHAASRLRGGRVVNSNSPS